MWPHKSVLEPESNYSSVEMIRPNEANGGYYSGLNQPPGEEYTADRPSVCQPHSYSNQPTELTCSATYAYPAALQTPDRSVSHAYHDFQTPRCTALTAQTTGQLGSVRPAEVELQSGSRLRRSNEVQPTGRGYDVMPDLVTAACCHLTPACLRETGAEKTTSTQDKPARGKKEGELADLGRSEASDEMDNQLMIDRLSAQLEAIFVRLHSKVYKHKWADFPLGSILLWLTSFSKFKRAFSRGNSIHDIFRGFVRFHEDWQHRD
ncbi:unnamed protein product [Protopolystoma xenopodis]|uniref:Uncharacterized protein n=1 Tax=Protopolystoma xenopodis TaxID=117903 RepID=A0A448WFW7_9PLAT|nr:unnamed protein product [Protopolystoma xenopodis]